MTYKVKLNTKPDIPNANGVIFPKLVLESAIKKYLEQPVSRRLGTTRYGDNGAILNLSDAAFTVLNIENVNGEYIAEIELIQTPKGKGIREQLNADDYRLCSMCVANTNEVSGNLEVQNDLGITYYTLYPKERCA